jgi:ribosomal protein S27AE
MGPGETRFTASCLGMLNPVMAFFEEFDATSAASGGHFCPDRTAHLLKSHHVAPITGARASSRRNEMAYCPRCGALDGEDDHATPYICDKCWFTEPDVGVEP